MPEPIDKPMTDAEFMLRWMKLERTRVVSSFPSKSIAKRSRQYIAKLDALEALAKLKCFCLPEQTNLRCERCVVLHRFRVAMERK